jgi:multidrug efflux system outer membrane protein
VVGTHVPDDLLPAPLDDRLDLLTALPAGLPSQVLLNRPDVLEAEHQLKSQNAEIGAARAAFFPTITLTGSGGTESTAVSRLFGPNMAVWSFAPQASVPIFDAGANRANLVYARAQRDAAVAQYEKAIQTAFSEVDKALARRATVDDQLAAEQADVADATEALRLSQARYERGADSYLNVLIAQRTLYTARQALIATLLARSTNLVTLYEALGGGLN